MTTGDVLDRPALGEAYHAFFVPGLMKPLAEKVLAAALPLRGEYMLDLACRTGVVARQFAPAIGGYGRIHAYDSDPEMIETARALPKPPGAPVDWRVGEATALDIKDASLNLAVCQQGLQFIADKPAALREIHRVLKPGGRLVVACWLPLDRQGLLATIAAAEKKRLEEAKLDAGPAEAPYSLGDKDALTALLNGAGFSDVKIKELEYDARLPSEDFVGQLEGLTHGRRPEFSADPAKYARFVEGLEQDLMGEIAPLIRTERVVFTVRSLLAVARR